MPLLVTASERESHQRERGKRAREMARRAGPWTRGEREVRCYARGRCPQGGGAATDRSSSSYCSFALGGTRYSEPPSLVSILMPLSPYAIAGGTWITRLPPSFIVASASSTPGLRIGCFLNFAAIGLRPGPSLLSNIWPDGRYALYFSLIRSPACGTQATLKVPHLPTSRSKYLTPPSVSKNCGAAAEAGFSSRSAAAAAAPDTSSLRPTGNCLTAGLD
mmetsp:Transcript_45780/g.148845  ORF Transcript_45780/g.148845 Transcript_45780/m.148845 type:complete len:219 (-) Transcript_45780:75-731(-)